MYGTGRKSEEWDNMCGKQYTSLSQEGLITYNITVSYI